MVVSEPVLASKEVNVLQAVNLTLGISAFLALADAFPKLVDFAAPFSLGMALYVALLITWITKLLVENHRSFGGARIAIRPRYAVFQLAMTILMFLTLIVSAKMAGSFNESIRWLGLSLSVGVAWLAVLAASFGRSFDLGKYPWAWVASALGTVVGTATLAALHLSPHSYGSCAILSGMLFLVIWDAAKTGTFVVI